MYQTQIAVAAPNHPLHQLNRDITLSDFCAHRELLIKGQNTLSFIKDKFRASESSWIVDHNETSVRAVCLGLGFAWYNKELVRAELESGELKELSFVQETNSS